MTQLTLFAPERTPEPLHKYGEPKIVRATWERAESPAVELAVIEVLRARPDEWLEMRDFGSVYQKHGIGSIFGHLLGRFERRGLLHTRVRYLGKGIGAEQPGSPNYCGFTCQYTLASTQGERC